MEFTELANFVFARHLTLAVHAALLFAVGVFVAVPVIRWRVTALQWLPVQVFRLVLRLMGGRPSILRMTLTIWLFNSAVMFLYMASGFHSMAPKALAVWVGMNVAVVTVVAGREEGASGMLSSAAQGRWTPSQQLGWLCSALVLALELPSFWYALAMGISLGWDVQRGEVAYLAGLSPRATAFMVFIVPALLVSALAEAVALRGAASIDGGRGDC